MNVVVATAPAVELPPLRRVLTGAAGFLVLSLVGAVQPTGLSWADAPGGLWAGPGALVLTGPALLVAHQFLALRAAPDQIVGQLAEALARAGSLAWGLVPLQLFFTVSTGRGPGVLALLLAGVGAAGLIWTSRHLLDQERAADAGAAEMARAHVLVLAWSSLTALIGLRIGVSVLA